MNRKASILLLVTPGMHMMGSVVAVMDATAVVMWFAEPIICIPDVTNGLPPRLTMLLKIRLQLTC